MGYLKPSGEVGYVSGPGRRCPVGVWLVTQPVNNSAESVMIGDLT